jgi:hypothetical protein
MIDLGIFFASLVYSELSFVSNRGANPNEQISSAKAKNPQSLPKSPTPTTDSTNNSTAVVAITQNWQ